MDHLEDLRRQLTADRDAELVVTPADDGVQVALPAPPSDTDEPPEPLHT